MIWGSPRRQYTWLALGARTFALLTLAMPLLLSSNQLMLLALLAIGSIWAAVTAGELLELPPTLLLVLDSVLVGSVAGLSSGSVCKRTLVAGYRPFAAGSAGDESRLQIPIEHWVHEGQPPRATVLALHGFGMGRPRLDAVALFASQWFRRGMDVALLTLPDHGARGPAGARFPGGRFAEAHVGRRRPAVGYHRIVGESSGAESLARTLPGSYRTSIRRRPAPRFQPGIRRGCRGARRRSPLYRETRPACCRVAPDRFSTFPVR